ncbi:MAG: tryptophan-rich sensory protein [Lachnospiraceae bacterium]|nr:tryptophan-rich sensory protein [Lachnospiraceae bacterium]
MKINGKVLAVFIAIPLIVGFVSGFISRNGMEQFGQLNQPPLAPPGFLFPIVWTILYVLMGIASYLVFVSNKEGQDIQDALTVYGVQLVVNFFWSIFFFNLEWYLFAFFWLVLLWVLILYTIRLFYPISQVAAYLLVPYLLWVTFAGYLNLSIYLLN